MGQRFLKEASLAADRQLVQNVVDLDAVGRTAALNSQIKEDQYGFNESISAGRPGLVNRIPLLLLLDYAAAFASVAHEWIFLILQAVKILKGWANLIERLYDGNEAYIESASGFVWSVL